MIHSRDRAGFAGRSRRLRVVGVMLATVTNVIVTNAFVGLFLSHEHVRERLQSKKRPLAAEPSFERSTPTLSSRTAVVYSAASVLEAAGPAWEVFEEDSVLQDGAASRAFEQDVLLGLRGADTVVMDRNAAGYGLGGLPPLMHSEEARQAGRLAARNVMLPFLIAAALVVVVSIPAQLAPTFHVVLLGLSLTRSAHVRSGFGRNTPNRFRRWADRAPARCSVYSRMPVDARISEPSDYGRSTGFGILFHGQPKEVRSQTPHEPLRSGCSRTGAGRLTTLPLTARRP